MTHHRHGIELFQTRHGLQQKDNDTPALHSLYRPGQQVRCYRLVILQDQHTECLTENLCRILIVCIPYIGDGYKELKGVLLVCFTDSSFDIPLDLRLPLLPMAVTGSVQASGQLQVMTNVVKPSSFL